MIAFTISWQESAERQFDVMIAFTAPADEPRLALPVWRPGRYLIQNYAANVSQWSATCGGDRREMWKDGKSSWRVEARAGEEIGARYRYYAGVLDAGSSFLDESEAWFNGSNLFMMVEGLRGQEVRLSVGAPADWRIETQLPRQDGNTFRAQGYDHLIDSPVIAAASLTRHSFHESGAMIHLVFVNDERIDTEQYVDPVRAIVRSQAALFGDLPVPEYRFLTHIGDKWHGVEHEASCSIVAKRSDLLGAKKGDAGYDHFLSICSHEFFHLWNVKRILPAVFAPYDYWQEALTRLLWVMEGTTSYYGELTLSRAGLWDEARYLRHLAGQIETLENQPGREHLSLSQASFDSWLQNDAHDRPNALISFYNKGEIVSALLDLLIMRESNGSKSLDDVMQLLWRERKPLEEDDFERAVDVILSREDGEGSRSDVRIDRLSARDSSPSSRLGMTHDFFRRYVHGTEPLPYEELLGAVGVCMETSPRAADPGLGATLRGEGERLIVAGVLRGGAGMKAGLLPGDEIVAIDGSRTTSESDATGVLRSLANGTPVEMLMARGGVIRSMTLVAAADPRVKIVLRTTGESALRDRWLRRTNG